LSSSAVLANVILPAMKRGQKKKPIIKESESKLVVYQGKEGAILFHSDFKTETIWATLDQLASLFGRDKSVISRHIKNIFNDKELVKNSVVAKNATTASDGKVYQVDYYNLDMIISVGYRVNSKTATKFRQWATKILRQHIVTGYTINEKRIALNYEQFMTAVAEVRALVSKSEQLTTEVVLDLVQLFADTWFSLDAYDKEAFGTGKVRKKKVKISADELAEELGKLRTALIKKGEAHDKFAAERTGQSLEGIIGNVLQSFGGQEVYPSIEEKAAHLLYFIIKNHPFVDGNKRSGAFAFVWFLARAKVLNIESMTPTALTALTIMIAESDPKDKDKLVQLVVLLIGGRKK
jgi:prophage maintenance system killer protein/predicted transcriptional regulator